MSLSVGMLANPVNVAADLPPKEVKTKALMGRTRAAYTMGVTLLSLATQYGRRHKKT